MRPLFKYFQPRELSLLYVRVLAAAFCSSPPLHTSLQAPSAHIENHKTISFLVVVALPLVIWREFTQAFWVALH